MTKVWMLFSVLLSVLWPEGRGERVLGKETEEFDFDGLPGAQHEFKIEVAAGKEECFYQKIVAGGKLHISFEVIHGGDRTLSVVLKRNEASGRHVIDAILQKTDGVLMHSAHETGPYAICLDNTMSRMASKLVYVFLVTYVEEEWSKYRQELEDIQLSVANFTTSIQNVQQSVTDALVHQAQSRMHVIKDWYLIVGNNTYIQRWSICQCAVIIVCSGIQVFFVRRLFRSTNVTPSSKPRA